MKRMLLVGFILAISLGSNISRAEVPMPLPMPIAPPTFVAPQPSIRPVVQPQPSIRVIQNRTVINTTRITVNNVQKHGFVGGYGMSGGYGYNYGYNYYNAYRSACFRGGYNRCGRRRHRKFFFLSVGGFSLGFGRTSF